MKNIYCGIFIFALAFQVINGQATLTVGPNGSYATIASALLVYQSGDIIQLEAQEYNGTDNRNFDFTGKNITIVGQGRLFTSINCEFLSRFAYVQADFVEKFFNFEGLTFKNCVINTVNVAYGGALYFKNNFTSLTLSDVGFENCQASRGGAIYAEGPIDDTEGHDVNIQIDNCYFGQNYANTTGGALYIYSGNVSITNSMFTKNRANDAGCIFLDNYSYISVFNCNFTSNSAIQSAAAIYSQRYNTGTVASSTFSHNVATDSGAIYTSVTRLDIIGCTFFNNTATYGEGGTFYFDASLVDMTDCYADTGYSGDMGGFGTIYNGGTLNYRGGSISNFEAYTAGALKVASDAKLNLYDTTISFCRGSGADGEAGAIYLIYRSKLLLVNTLLDSNSANANGGALWCGDSSINVTGTTSFNNNQAPSDNDIHCSTIISGTSCRVYGGDWQDFCAAVEPDESFPVGYKILIGVVAGIAVVTVGGVLLFACYFKDRKKKRQEGQLWDHIQEDNKPATPNDD